MFDHKTMKETFENFDLIGELEKFLDGIEIARYGKILGEDGPFGDQFSQYLYELIQMRLDHFDEYMKLVGRIKKTYGGQDEN
jgi:hypothetical protein